jgi:ribonuclease HII
MLTLSFSNKMIEAGCDEAGRGCLAGPVFAAAVILPRDFSNALLNDSKKLKEKDRDSLRKIIESEAVSWAVASVDNLLIDEINILNASFLAMHLAIDKLTKVPEFLLIDGNRFKPYKNIHHQCIIKGDGKYLPIAAASILAKTHRDEFMKAAHWKYPQYNWSQNKGYPTAAHRRAIALHGVTPLHRMTFNMNEQLKLDF